MISFIMASKKQIAWRKKFAKLYGKKKKGSKSTKSTKSKISSDDLKRRKVVAKSEKLYKEDPKKWNLEKPKTKKLFKK